MSNEHTALAALTPEMTLSQLMDTLVLHFDESDTDNCEFEVAGLENGKPIKLAFSITLRRISA